MSFRVINRTAQHLLIKNNYHFQFTKRLILSAAYQCNDDWKKRFDEPLIKEIDLDTFFYQINEKLTKKTNITPTDVDLYLNRASSKNLNEIINVVQRFRKNWRSHAMFDSSHHAFIRILLEGANYDKLVDALNKRVEYGIFPDKFCYNMALDSMIEAKQYENALKVAVVRMLQEDLDSLIGNYLSLKAIDLYLKNNDLASIIKNELFAETEAEEENAEAADEGDGDDDEEDEIEYIRIPYVRNPFFDDHFDIKETISLIGKTLWLVGNAIGNKNKELSDNCILYGLIMYKKWDKANQFLDSNKNSIKLANDLAEGLAKQFITTAFQDEPNNDALQLLERLRDIKTVSQKTLSEQIDDAVSTISRLEASEIVELKNLYKEFTKRREERMKLDLDKLLKIEMIDQIKMKRKEFKERERKLYFFENHEHFQLLEHEAKIKIKEAEEASNIEEEYIPPRIRR